MAAPTKKAANTSNPDNGESSVAGITIAGFSLEMTDSVPNIPKRGRGFSPDTIQIANALLESERTQKALVFRGVSTEQRNALNQKVDAAKKYIDSQREKGADGKVKQPFEVRKGYNTATGEYFFGPRAVIEGHMAKAS